MLDMIKVRYYEYGCESCGRDRYHVQYRINKKGAECYRCRTREEAEEKLAELRAKRPGNPGIYTMQRRETRLDRYGCEIHPLESIRWM